MICRDLAAKEKEEQEQAGQHSEETKPAKRGRKKAMPTTPEPEEEAISPVK